MAVVERRDREFAEEIASHLQMHSEENLRLRAPAIKLVVDILPYFRNYRSMGLLSPAVVTRCAERFSALGAKPRLQIMRLLLSAHPNGMVVGEIQEELAIPASTLSHHLEKLKQVGLVTVRRDRQFLWYAADTNALQELLGFLYEECCTRSRAVAPEAVVHIAGLRVSRPEKHKEIIP